MRAEQPTELGKPRRKIKVKVGVPYNGLNNIPFPPPRNYYWPPQGGTFVAVSFVLCSVLLIFKSFKCFNFTNSICPIYFVQYR